MKIATYSIGLVLLAALTAPQANATLYGDIYGFTLHETVRDEVELMVEKFIPKVVKSTNMDIQDKHVDLAVRENYAELCYNENTSVRYEECIRIAKEIREVAQRETLIRTVGRDLQRIAYTYESGTTGYTGQKENTMFQDMYEIGKIWESGIDKMTNPIKQAPIRKEEFNDLSENGEDELEELMGEIKNIINGYFQGGGAAKQEVYNKRLYHAYVGIGWRYRHGVNYIRTREQGCEDEDDEWVGDMTELEYLRIRSCKLEFLLRDLHNLLVPSYFDTELTPNEIAILPTKDVNDDLYIWFRKDDIGLQWKRPLRPVLPGLITSQNQASESGTYSDAPSEPGENGGICSHPFGRRGYLCRPVEADRCITNDADNFDADGSRILLTGCEPQNMYGLVRETLSGPDLCKVGGWRIPVQQNEQQVQDTPQEDSNIKPGKCTNCAVDMYCGNCGGRGGTAAPKNADGVIKICIEDNSLAPAKYTIIHEMVHAQEFCDAPPGFGITSDNCCPLEYSAHTISCKAMADDGLLDGTGIGIEECASMLTNDTCGNWRNACTKVDVKAEDRQRLMDAIKPGPNDQTCAQAINSLDPRAASIRESSKKTCDTDCRTEYENTIGNNLCYIGQCVEESLEEHRIIPGRIPYGTQDEAFPWDACVKEDPQLGTFLELPPLSRTFLPAYKGQHILQQMDLLLCQGNALPALSPPALCELDPRRRTSLPTEFSFEMGTSLLSQNREQQSRAEELSLNMENIAARLGAQIYKEYFNKALRELTDIVRAVNMITGQLGTLDIADSTCPRFFTGNCNAL